MRKRWENKDVVRDERGDSLRLKRVILLRDARASTERRERIGRMVRLSPVLIDHVCVKPRVSDAVHDSRSACYQAWILDNLNVTSHRHLHALNFPNTAAGEREKGWSEAIVAMQTMQREMEAEIHQEGGGEGLREGEGRIDRE